MASLGLRPWAHCSEGDMSVPNHQGLRESRPHTWPWHGRPCASWTGPAPRRHASSSSRAACALLCLCGSHLGRKCQVGGPPLWGPSGTALASVLRLPRYLPIFIPTRELPKNEGLGSALWGYGPST